MEALQKKKFVRQFTKSVLTRFHMSLILLGTSLAGLGFSKLLLALGLNNMTIRFSIVMAFAYLCFFLLMKLWLAYLTSPYRRSLTARSGIDMGDIIPNIDGVPFAREGITPAFTGQGGLSGGGGATRSFAGLAENVVAETGKAAGETVADAVDGSILDSDDGWIVLLVLGVILAVIFGVGIFLIYQAPVIISDAAFQCVLASSLIKSAKKTDSPDWAGSLFRSTWVAFLSALILSAALGAVASHYCPLAVKLSDIFKHCV